jgi:hypothetical protein
MSACRIQRENLEERTLTMEPTAGRNYRSDNGSDGRRYLVKPGIPYPGVNREKLPAKCLPFPVMVGGIYQVVLPGYPSEPS